MTNVSVDAISDTEFEESVIEEVKDDGNYWEVRRADAWGMLFGLDKKYGVEPKIGQTCRVYGGGSFIRGVAIDGRVVWYRTKEEDDEFHEISLYGADATEWLRRWDAGDSVWSVEMGGIGPGYEQAIQMAAAELLRVILHKEYDIATWIPAEGEEAPTQAWKHDRAEIEELVSKIQAFKDLGLSGAQFGAAMNVATMLYRHGPREAMKMAPQDRKIQVSKNFP